MKMATDPHLAIPDNHKVKLEERKIFNESSHNFFDFKIDSPLIQSMVIPEDLRSAMKKKGLLKPSMEIRKDATPMTILVADA